MNYKNIIIFSAPRSGSTVIYNLIKETITDIPVIKTHEVENFETDNLYIIPIRHPYNSIVSACLCSDIDFRNDCRFNDCLVNYLEYGGKKLIDITEKPNIMVFYYEFFYKNLHNIFIRLENKLNIVFDSNKKTQLIEEHSINNVKNKIKNFNSFKQYDQESHYHGKHISKYNGETNYKNILKEHQIKLLRNNSVLNVILKKFYYNAKS